MTLLTVETTEPEQTRALAELLGRRLAAGDVLCLIGDLGAGKTTFTQGLALGLDMPTGTVVNSPTFLLIAEHPGGRVPLYHLDVYRLSDSSALYDLAFDEYLNGDGVVVIEWANRIADALPVSRLDIGLEEASDFDTRVITFMPHGARAEELTAYLAEAWSLTFLCLDTGGDYTMLALADETADGRILSVSVFEGRRTLSRRLFGQIDALLASEQMTFADVSAIAVGLGPGSFTGVRVGVTTAKTLAQVTNKPFVGIGTLEAYAQIWHDQDPDVTVVTILPSRREEVYAAISQNGALIGEPFAATYTEMRDRLDALQSAGDVILTGAPDLLGPLSHITSLCQPWTPPEGFAAVAAQRLISQEYSDPIGLVPLYVVAPAISVPKDITILPGMMKVSS